MRYRRVRYDVFICMLCAAGAAFLAGKAADKYTERTYDSYVESKEVAPGEVGGVAGDDVYRITCIDDIRAHDVFTMETEGIAYRNEGQGYFGGIYLYNVELPSGERVAMTISNKNVVSEGDYYTGINTLPVGRMVEADLTEDESFMEQVNYKGDQPLTATDFYVDMVGEGIYMSEHSYKNDIRGWVQILTGIVVFAVVHNLGARLGIFPYFFASKRVREELEKTEWD